MNPIIAFFFAKVLESIPLHMDEFHRKLFYIIVSFNTFFFAKLFKNFNLNTI